MNREPVSREDPPVESSSQERRLTAEQLSEFRARVAKKLQLAAQRAQMASQPTMRGIQQGSNNKGVPHGSGAGRQSY